MTDISKLLGKTIKDISVNDERDEIVFTLEDGIQYRMYHEQYCCENVAIEDINGDLKDLIGSPITMAEESTSEDVINGKPEYPDSFTWTFYKLATVKGYVTLRWLGESNGYYSESVDFCQVGKSKWDDE